MTLEERHWLSEEEIKAEELKQLEDSIALVEGKIDPTEASIEELYTPQEVELALTDFRHWLRLVWKFLDLPRPTEVQFEIANYLQELYTKAEMLEDSTKTNDKIIQAFRGIGKTWITSAYIVWRLVLNKEEKVLIVSQTADHSGRIIKFVKTLITKFPLAYHLDPSQDKSLKNQETSFNVFGIIENVQPSVMALGIGGQLQGLRASIIVADDIEGQKNSATEDQRSKLVDQCNEFSAILSTNVGETAIPTNHIVMLGTYQTEESIYLYLENKGFDVRIYPAEYPKDISLYRGKLAPYLAKRLADDSSIVGKAIDTRIDDKRLEQSKLRQTKASYQMQYLLDPSLSDELKYPLKLRDLIVAPLHLEYGFSNIQHTNSKTYRYSDTDFTVGFKGDYLYKGAYNTQDMKYSRILMFIDPSGRGADLSTLAVVAELGGMLYLLALRGFKNGHSEESLAETVSIAKAFNVSKIVFEANYGGGMYGQVLKPLLDKYYPCSLQEVTNTTQKEVRIINSLEPVMNNHRLIIDESIIEEDYDRFFHKDYGRTHSFLYQLTHLSKEKGCLTHDDFIDVVGMAVEFYSKSVSIDTEKFAKEVFEAHKVEQMHKHFRATNSFGTHQVKEPRKDRIILSEKPNYKKKINLLRILDGIHR